MSECLHHVLFEVALMEGSATVTLCSQRWCLKGACRNEQSCCRQSACCQSRKKQAEQGSLFPTDHPCCLWSSLLENNDSLSLRAFSWTRVSEQSLIQVRWFGAAIFLVFGSLYCSVQSYSSDPWKWQIHRTQGWGWQHQMLSSHTYILLPYLSVQ